MKLFLATVMDIPKTQHINRYAQEQLGMQRHVKSFMIQQKYSGLCPGGTNTGTSGTLNPNKNKAKSIQRNKRPQKR